MKTVIFRLIRRSLSACILLILQSYPVHASNPTLIFELSWNGKATDKVTIEVILTGARTFITDSGEVDFRFFQQQVGPDIYHNLVGEITAKNEYGTPLPYRKVETEQGGIRWLISPGNSNEVVVAYEINYKYKRNMGYVGTVLDSLLCGTLEATFLVPSLPFPLPFPFRKGDIKIKFNTPPDLRIYTPWDVDGVYYHIWHQAGADPLETALYTYYTFMSDCFAIGEFWERSELVNGLNFNVIISKLIPNLKQSDLERIYGDSKACFEYINDVWRKSVGTKYLIVYLPFHPDGNGIYLSECSASQGSTLYGVQNAAGGGMLMHQMCHRWDGFLPFMLNMDGGNYSYYNFKEGGTVYYEVKGSANVGYQKMIQREIDAYETIRGTEKDKPIALANHGSGNPADEIIFYQKACLVHYLLDKEIQMRTNYEKNLDDVERALYLEYGRYPGHDPPQISMGKYITLINNITGHDFTSFFDQYYYSVGDIDIRADLTSDPDKNGKTVFDEVLLNESPSTPLYYPHSATTDGWETEIAAINTSSTQTATCSLYGYSNQGALIETKSVTLNPHGRREIIISREFTNHQSISYLILSSNMNTVAGYTKFYQQGQYRVAIPSVSYINTSDIYVSHIASDAEWWTGISLVNTTAASKTLTINFSDGRTQQMTLTANEHKAFAVKDLFNGVPQPSIKSAVITNAAGIVGLELFATYNGKQMEGILLTERTATSLYYPYVLNNADWWTGIVAYNPSSSPSNITVTSYNESGTYLSSANATVAAREKYIGTPDQLALPAQTAWFRIDATGALSGFELIGTRSLDRLSSYSGNGGTGSKTGVFAKIENSGWTTISLVNTENSTATVTLTAYNVDGTALSSQKFYVGSHAVLFNSAEGLFLQSIAGATYIAFTSDRNMVGLQLNYSADGAMLDGLPGM